MSFLAGLTTYLGAGVLVLLSIKAAQFIYTYSGFFGSTLIKYQHGKDQYALVTGGTDGIGYALARELAKRGFNLILLARDAQKLEKRRREIQQDHDNIQVECILLNVLHASPSDIEKSIAKISHLRITILVNNVGGVPIQLPAFKTLSEFNAIEIENLITLNSRFLAHVTSLTLPILSRNGPSLILNISSGAQVGIPLMAMYSACKGFVRSFSIALNRECKSEKIPIDVLCIVTGDVQSNSNTMPMNLMMPSSEAFASATLNRVGPAVLTGNVELTPYVPHALGLGFLDMLPEPMKRIALVDALKPKRKFFDKNV